MTGPRGPTEGPLDLRAVEARLKAAKRGPWHMAMPAIEDCPEYDSLAAVEASSGECVIDACDDTDAAFISNAPTDVAGLLAYCRALRAVGDRLAAALQESRKRLVAAELVGGEDLASLDVLLGDFAVARAQATDEEGK